MVTCHPKAACHEIAVFSSSKSNPSEVVCREWTLNYLRKGKRDVCSSCWVFPVCVYVFILWCHWTIKNKINNYNKIKKIKPEKARFTHGWRSLWQLGLIGRGQLVSCTHSLVPTPFNIWGQKNHWTPQCTYLWTLETRKNARYIMEELLGFRSRKNASGKASNFVKHGARDQNKLAKIYMKRSSFLRRNEYITHTCIHIISKTISK